MLALKTIARRSKGSSHLLSSLRKESFHFEAAQAIYERISRAVESTADVPTWEELLGDPVLDEDVRKEMRQFKKKAIVGRDACKRAAAQLDKYRRLRTIYEASELVRKAVNAGSADPEVLIEAMNNAAIEARSGGNAEDQLTHIGTADRKAFKLLKSILRDEGNYLSTGFRAYDERNRGIAKGSLWILAASTGGGKSAMALQVARNMALQGHRVCIVCLEMDEREVMTRRAASVSQISMELMIAPKKMTNAQRERIERRFARYHKMVKQKGGIETYYVPDGEVNIKEVLYTLKPYKYDCIVIDYVGLLETGDGDQQWRELSSAARFGKRFATSTGSVVALCAQLSEDKGIRYSKGMKEHASNMWAWVYDSVAGPGIVEIDQQKARQQAAFTFPLYFDLPRMTIRDLQPDELEEYGETAASEDTTAIEGKNSWKGRSKAMAKRDKDKPKGLKKSMGGAQEYYVV